MKSVKHPSAVSPTPPRRPRRSAHAGLAALAALAVLSVGTAAPAAAGDPSQWGIDGGGGKTGDVVIMRKVNEYEGQHRRGGDMGDTRGMLPSARIGDDPPDPPGPPG